MKSLSGQERKLLVIQTFDGLAYALAGIFVTLFFYSHSGLQITALFRALAFASMAFFFALSGKLLRYMSSGTLIRLGIYGGALFYLLLFLLREGSIRWFVPLAILDGFAGGVFWAGFNLNQYILTKRGSRIAYFGWGQALWQLAMGLGPAIGGAIISGVGATALGKTGGYITLFILVSIIMFIVAVLVGKLPGHEMPEFRYRHLLTHKRSRGWKLVLSQQVALGFFDVAFSTVSGILLYLIVRDESRLGLMFTIGALIAAASGVAVTRLLTRFAWVYWIGALGSAVAITIFALFQTMTGVWAMFVISGLTVPFMMTKLSAAYFDEMDKSSGAWQKKFHLMIEKDVVLGLIRMTSYLLLFLVLTFGDDVKLARTFLFILPIFPLTIGVLLTLQSRREGQIAVVPPLPSEVI